MTYARTAAVLAALALATPVLAQSMPGQGMGLGGFGGMGYMMGNPPGGGYGQQPGWTPQGPGYGMMGPQGGWGQQMPMMPWGQGMMQGPGMMPGMMQGPGMMMPGMGFGPGPQVSPFVDGNGDGVVSADEASAIAAAHFDVLDPDGNDAVTRDEFLGAAPLGMMGGAMVPGWRSDTRREARFGEMDADGDGSVTRAEFFGAARSGFDGSDADGDGTVTVWEFRAANRPF